MNTDRFKFRIWNDTLKHYIPNSDAIIDGRTGKKFHGSIFSVKYTIEQCTGLKDKNGKLIYEGDVVRYYRSTAMCLGGERIASVLWYEKYGAWGILTTLGDGYDMCDAIKFGIEIIGNIHEMEIETERS